MRNAFHKIFSLRPTVNCVRGEGKRQETGRERKRERQEDRERKRETGIETVIERPEERYRKRGTGIECKEGTDR